MIATERKEETLQLEYVFVSNMKSGLMQLLRPSSFSSSPSRTSCDDDDDDCCSLASTSYSLSTTSSSFEDERTTTTTTNSRRKVTFSDETNEIYFVEQIYPKEDLNKYFYSPKDEKRFRREAKLERKLLAELGVDESNHYEGELQNLNNMDFNNNNNERIRNISNVVVLHNNKIETFCDAAGGKQQHSLNNDKSVDNFFDNDNFWGGSMTYY